MNEKLKLISSDFAEYLQSVVRLNELQKITDTLDKELEHSQRSMLEIKSMFDSFSKTQIQVQVTSDTDRHEELTKKVLEAPPPNGLLPDMIDKSNELDDLDDILASIRMRAENIKSDYEKLAPQINHATRTHSFGDLGLDQYVASLNHLNKQMINIKVTKKDKLNARNLELEEKLSKLCQEVHLFTQMIEANSSMHNVSNKNWSTIEEGSSITQYENMISKLLSGVNEVTYLLKNKN